jgi:hypothetical protein
VTLSGFAADLEIHRIINMAFLRCSPKQGVSFSKNVGAPTFSLSFSHSPLSALLLFKSFAPSFVPYHTYPLYLQEYARLAQEQGVPLLVIPVPLGLVIWRPLPTCHGSRATWPLFPFTSHSQSCYPTFTHPSRSLVTMIPSQGTNSYTMPIALSRPTVHFYRCDLPGEIRS